MIQQPLQQRQRHAVTAMSAQAAKTVDCGVIIAGAGPAGLCCALALARRGLSDIHVVERNPSSTIFEVDKAYLYRIDGRGTKASKATGSCGRIVVVPRVLNKLPNRSHPRTGLLQGSG